MKLFRQPEKTRLTVAGEPKQSPQVPRPPPEMDTNLRAKVDGIIKELETMQLNIETIYNYIDELNNNPTYTIVVNADNIEKKRRGRPKS